VSHLFGIDGIKEKIMILSSLSMSGKEFCGRYAMGSDEHHKVYDLATYTKTTKHIVSSYMIDISVKLRSVVDSLRSLGMEVSLDEYIKVYNSGSCADGNSKEKNFRFICNNIIHAESFNLDFVGNKKYHTDMVWWSGEVTVSGVYQHKKWEFFFSVLDWCDSIVEFLDESETQIANMQGESRDIQGHS